MAWAALLLVAAYFGPRLIGLSYRFDAWVERHFSVDEPGPQEPADRGRPPPKP